MLNFVLEVIKLLVDQLGTFEVCFLRFLRLIFSCATKMLPFWVSIECSEYSRRSLPSRRLELQCLPTLCEFHCSFPIVVIFLGSKILILCLHSLLLLIQNSRDPRTDFWPFLWVTILLRSSLQSTSSVASLNSDLCLLKLVILPCSVWKTAPGKWGHSQSSPH